MGGEKWRRADANKELKRIADMFFSIRGEPEDWEMQDTKKRALESLGGLSETEWHEVMSAIAVIALRERIEDPVSQEANKYWLRDLQTIYAMGAG